MKMYFLFKVYPSVTAILVHEKEGAWPHSAQRIPLCPQAQRDLRRLKARVKVPDREPQVRKQVPGVHPQPGPAGSFDGEDCWEVSITQSVGKALLHTTLGTAHTYNTLAYT